MFDVAAPGIGLLMRRAAPATAACVDLLPAQVLSVGKQADVSKMPAYTSSESYNHPATSQP